MLAEALSAPTADLIKQAVNDKVFDILVMLALRTFKEGEFKVLESVIELLTNLMFEMVSY